MWRKGIHKIHEIFVFLWLLALLGGLAGVVSAVAVPTSAAYGTHPRQTLDLRLPDAPPPFPTLLVIHGGGYQFGDKTQLNDYAERFVARGYAVVTFNYRFAPAYPHPAQARDALCAWGWTLAHADAYGFDTERLVVIGESAGAALALGMANGAWQADAAVGAWAASADPDDACLTPLASERRLAGAVLYYPFLFATPDTYPALTTLVLYPFLDVPVGQRDLLARRWAEVNPMRGIDAADPPTLILHGTGDDVVPASDSAALFDALTAAGVAVETAYLPDADHGFIGWMDNPVGVAAAQTVEGWLRRSGFGG